MKKNLAVIVLLALFAWAWADEWYTVAERFRILDSLEYSGGFEEAQMYCLEQHGKFCPHTVRNWTDCISSWEHAYYPLVSIRVPFSSEELARCKPGDLDFGKGEYSILGYGRAWLSARVVFASPVLKDYVKAWCMNQAFFAFTGAFEASVLQVGNTIVVLEALPAATAISQMRHYKKVSPTLKEKIAKYAESHEEKNGKEVYKLARILFDTYEYLTWDTDGNVIKRNVVNPSVEEKIPYSLE